VFENLGLVPFERAQEVHDRDVLEQRTASGKGAAKLRWYGRPAARPHGVSILYECECFFGRDEFTGDAVSPI
jgi:hypothetical protein